MSVQMKSVLDMSIEDLDRELIARGAQVPGEKRFAFRDSEGTLERAAIMTQVKEMYAITPLPDKTLSHIETYELVNALMFKTGRLREDSCRGVWGIDDRKDLYEIEDEAVRRNAGCVAAVLEKDGLTAKTRGLAAIKVKTYGKAFNLCHFEPFYDQPVVSGRVGSGFLVAEDIIATAGHVAENGNVTDLRFVFGFSLPKPDKTKTDFKEENIYYGKEIIHREYDPLKTGSDWALVRLDRKVRGQTIASLSKSPIFCGQSIYIIGHPVGLPLKIAGSANVCDINEACFVANLDIYSGNSGSPVFDENTHEVIGMVVRGDNRDFRWTDQGWISVIYPNFSMPARGAQCTRASQFISFCVDFGGHIGMKDGQPVEGQKNEEEVKP